MLTASEIIELNRRLGGGVRYSAPVEIALHQGGGKNVYRQIAYLWIAILVGHPFIDGNKRTAYLVARHLLKRSGITISAAGKVRLQEEVKEIASKNIENIVIVERRVRYAVKGA